MAMVNMNVIEIIREVYDDLLNNVILKNVPKDCPNIDEIKTNYLAYLLETYRSHKPGFSKEELKDFIISQQKELWDDALIYDIYRKFVKDFYYDRLVKLSESSFRLADISRECDLTINKEKRDQLLFGFTEYSKRVKPCFTEYAKEFAEEGYKDAMYASGDRGEISERLKVTIEMEKDH